MIEIIREKGFSTVSTIGTSSSRRRLITSIETHSTTFGHIRDWESCRVHTRLYPLHNQIQETVDRLLNVCTRTGRGLKVGKTELIGQLLSSGCAHLPTILQIRLIAADYDVRSVTIGVYLECDFFGESRHLFCGVYKGLLLFA